MQNNTEILKINACQSEDKSSGKTVLWNKNLIIIVDFQV